MAYLDTQDPTRAIITLSSVTTAGSYLGPTLSTYTYTGNFVQLNSGIYYTLDPVLGVITFKNILANNAVVALNFRYVGQTTPIFNPAFPSSPTNQLALLKFDETAPAMVNSSLPNGTIPITEDLTHYAAWGVTKIARDNGQGNFILQVLDLNNSLIGPSLVPPVVYQPNNSRARSMWTSKPACLI